MWRFVAVASVLAGLVSWMDILVTVIHLDGLCCFVGWQGHAGLITLRLSLLGSTAGARPGRARIIECCTRPVNSSVLLSHHSTLTHLMN